MWEVELLFYREVVLKIVIYRVLQRQLNQKPPNVTYDVRTGLNGDHLRYRDQLKNGPEVV